MKALKSRIGQLEHIHDRADEMIEIPTHEGSLRMSEGQLREIMVEIDGKTRGLPHVTRETSNAPVDLK